MADAGLRDSGGKLTMRRRWTTRDSLHRSSRIGAVVLASASLLLAACSGTVSGATAGTVAFIPGYQPGGGTPTTSVVPQGYGATSQPILVDLGDTSATQMFIHLSQTYAPEGPVTLIITNSSTTMKHELVGFATKTPAANYPIVGFEGDPNKIDEDAAGKVVIDTGAALAPGATKVMTIDMAAGHYALVCNLSGHYKAGMHVDFWATPVVPHH